MTEQASTFIAKSTIKAADIEHRRTINYNIGKYNAAVPAGKAQFYDLQLARERAKNMKWRAIETLDQQLEEFERHLTARGGKVIWAETAQQALDEILKICHARQCKTIVKSKSMVTEEIQLNHFLEKHGIESIETDLGEFIQQLDGEAPYHIVTPATHKSKEDIPLFAEKLGTAPRLRPEQLTLIARNILRKKYTEAEIGITGATPDRGHRRYCYCRKRGQRTLKLCYLLCMCHCRYRKNDPLLIRPGFWRCCQPSAPAAVTAYNTIVRPRQPGETDGRRNVCNTIRQWKNQPVGKQKARRPYCIRCGAASACPVYKNIGGHSYNTTYSGL